MTDEDRSASHAMTVMMIALVGMMEESFKAMQQLPKVADDPLFQKALAAFRVLEAKLSIANEAASARRMSEGNHP